MEDKKKQSWRLGELLVQKGYITWEQLEDVLKQQREGQQKEADGLLLYSSKNKKPPPIFNLGEILVRNGWIGWDQLTEALRIQETSGLRLGDILTSKGFVNKKDLQRALAIQFNMSFVDFDKIQVAPEITQFLPKRLAYEHKIFPLVRKGVSLLVAISDAHDIKSQEAAQKTLTDFEVLWALSTVEDIQKAIQRFYGPE